jgi:hypothetical protein
MGLGDLTTPPPGVREAADLIAGLDRCFLTGFGRLGPEQAAALAAFGRALAGTPLDGPLAEAVAAIGRNEFVERHFAAVAAARAAVRLAGPWQGRMTIRCRWRTGAQRRAAGRCGSGRRVPATG